MTRPLLCVPVVTPLRGTRVDADGLAALLRFQVAQGADRIFVSGTTGEHPRLDAAGRETVRDVSITTLRGTGVPCWVGVTGQTAEETAALAAGAHGADAIVLAPGAIGGPVDLPRLLDRLDHPRILLYDNPDLSGGRLLLPAEVAPVRDRVVAIKISAPTAAVRPWLDVLPVWVGYPEAWFELQSEGNRPEGVVMGMANALPADWATCLRQDTPALRRRFAAYTAATTFDGRRRTVACAKAALVEQAVIARADVLPGTPALDAEQERLFRARFRALRSEAP